MVRAGSSGPFVVVPAGPAGAPGAPGATGATGPAGPTGASGLNPLISSLGWAPTAALQTRVLTVLAAGHAAGLYDVGWTPIVRTASGGTSYLQPSITFSAPLFGATSIAWLVNANANLSLGATGAVMPIGQTGSPRSSQSFYVISDGTADIVVTFTAQATGAFGTPVVDLYCFAQRVAS